jgi:hypothetical protein
MSAAVFADEKSIYSMLSPIPGRTTGRHASRLSASP